MAPASRIDHQPSSLKLNQPHRPQNPQIIDYKAIVPFIGCQGDRWDAASCQMRRPYSFGIFACPNVISAIFPARHPRTGFSMTDAHVWVHVKLRELRRGSNLDHQKAITELPGTETPLCRFLFCKTHVENELSNIPPQKNTRGMNWKHGKGMP